MADANWLGTLLCFGPRWALAMPIVVLLPLALGIERRAVWPLAAAGAIAAGPLSGLSLPLLADRAPTGERQSLRVLTLNTDGRADPERVRAIIAAAAPTVVTLQECTTEGSKEIFDGSWNVLSDGELVIASRSPITGLESLDSPLIPPWRSPAMRCRLALPGGDVNFVSVHVRSPRDGLAAVLQHSHQALGALMNNANQRRLETEAISSWIGQKPASTVIAGDLNCTVESQIYGSSWGGYRNSFSRAGLGWGATFFSRWHGVRIDHILTDQHWSSRGCWVGPNVGSAHRPVIADLISD